MTTNFAAHFGQTPVLLVVVHCFTTEQVECNVAIAFEAGADGIFLIGGKMDTQAICACYGKLRPQYPDAWIGVNFLALTPEAAFEAAPTGLNGLWADNAGTQPDRQGVLYCQAIQPFRAERPDLLYFGGVAFKYQREVENVAEAARTSLAWVDVVTTSGEGTGSAPDVAKIAAMKNAIGDAPLAIASGITPENVGDYLGICDCFLVATGISSSAKELDPARVAQLATLIHHARRATPPARGDSPGKPVAP